MANKVLIKQFKNKAKKPVAGLTPEHAVYDANGVRLDAKLGNVNLQEFRDLQQQCVNNIKQQQDTTETYINNKVVSAKVEIDAKHEEAAQLTQASMIGSNAEGLEGSNVQANLNDASNKLTELGQQVIYDVSANNDGATFASLSVLLSSENLATLIPTAVRCGGMSIRFIQSSDNKYVQARCMAQNFTTDVTQWQGVDEEPIAGSQNLVTSGGVKNADEAVLNKAVSFTEEISEPHYVAQLNDKTKNVAGKYINWQTGGEATNESYKHSDYIRVKKGVLYMTNALIVHFAFYDFNKNFMAFPDSNGSILYFDGTTVRGFSDNLNKSVFKSPIDGYIRVSFTASDLGFIAIRSTSDDTSNVAISDSVTPTIVYPYGYEELSKEVGEISEVADEAKELSENNDETIKEVSNEMTRKHMVSVNKLDKTKLKPGYMSKSGVISPGSASYSYSEKIPVSEGDIVICSRSLNGSIGSSASYGGARFLTAFNAEGNAVPESGAEYVHRYTVPSGIVAIVVSMSQNDRWPFVSTNGSEVYDEYYDYFAYYAKGKFLSNIALHCYLPSEICVAVGRTIELYNELVCLEANKYHIDWECSVGVDYKRKWSVTGTNANIGNYSLKMKIYDDDLTLVKELSTTVKIVADTIPANTFIVPIGDSLTNVKPWEPEVQTLSNSKVLYVGTRGKAQDGYYHEGRSGATSEWYNANAQYTFDNSYVGNPNVDGKSNPFWDGSKFSLSHYITQQGAYLAGTPTAIQILLGTNGIQLNPTLNVEYIVSIVDKIRTEYPTIPIFVCNTIYRSNQNGYYSTGGQGYSAAADFQYSADMKIMNLQNALNEALAEYTGVYIVPLSICMDREYDFGNIPVPVNPRLTDITIDIPNESIHPQDAGYLQMADVMYSCYCAHLT